jgi:hypothetical protein
MPSTLQRLGASFAVLATLLIAGCAADPEPRPTVRVIEGSVSADGAELEAGEPLEVAPGVTLTTSGTTALAEITWPDDSVTRLGGGAEYVVGEVAARGQLVDGRAWSRVSADAVTFMLTLPNGDVSADPGTTFLVDCGDPCVVSVLDGVALSGGDELVGPAFAEVNRGFGEASPLAWDTVFGDEWALQNAEFDDAAGFAAASELYADQDPALASLAGVFRGTVTTTALDCTGWGCDQLDVVGRTGEREYTFSIVCDGGAPCVGEVDTQHGKGQEVEATERTALTFDGSFYRWSIVNPNSGELCVPEFGTSGRYENTITWELRPSHAEVAGGRFVVTAMEGTGTSVVTLAERATDPRCDQFEQATTTHNLYTMERVDLTGSPAPAPSTVAPERAVDEEPSQVEAGTVSELSSGDPAAPSVLRGLPTIQDLQITPTQGILMAVLSIILLLIVGYPSHLIGSTLSEQHDRMFAWTSRLRPSAGTRVATARARLVERLAGMPGWAPIGFGVAASAIIAGFVDPEFGFNLGSLRLLISFAAMFCIESLLGWWLIARLVRRADPDLKPKLEFKTFSLAVVALAVLVSRLIGFEPGMVFGLILGLSFGSQLAVERKARIAVTGIGYTFAIGMFGWIGYSLSSELIGSSPGLIGAFGIELLSGLTIGSVAALPIVLLPLAVFDGGTLFKWNKVLWAVLYAVSLAWFFAVLLPLPISWVGVGLPLVVWITLYCCYALGAILLWVAFRFWIRKPGVTADAAVPESGAAEEADAEATR